MSSQIKQFHNALKHGGFSATAILPGAAILPGGDPNAFKKQHEELVAELESSGYFRTMLFE